MEQDIKLGSVGEMKIAFSGGKATLSATVATEGGFSGSLTLTEDAGVLIDLIEKAVEKAIPSTAAIDPAIFAVIKAAVKSL